MQTRARSGMTDLLKLLFSVMVVLYHARAFAGKGEQALGRCGYIAVDFFFIVAGCYLARSAERGARAESVGADTLRYMGRRLGRIYPEYLAALVIAMGVRIAVEGLSPALAALRDAAGEWTMLQQSGFYEDGLVGAGWYLSALVLSSLLLYPMARKWREGFLYIGAPVLFIALFGYSYRALETLQGPKVWHGAFYGGMLRAVMEMCLGGWVYGLAGRACEWRLRGWARAVFTLAEVAIYAGVLAVCLFGRQSGKGDWAVVLLLGLATLITQSDLSFSGQIVRGRAFSWLGGLSYSVYLGHRFWSKCIDRIAFMADWSFNRKLLAYLVLSAVTAIVVMIGGRLVRRAAAAVRRRALEAP